MKTVVYRIVNKVNGKCYVGSSWRFAKRWIRHMVDLKGGFHHSKTMQEDFKVMGKKVFYHEILEEFDTAGPAREREAYWIKKFDSHRNGYNFCADGRSPDDPTWLTEASKEYWENQVNRDEASRRTKRHFSKQENRDAAREKQIEFIKRHPIVSKRIARAGGLAVAAQTRERTRREIMRSDGVKYLAIRDAARDLARSDKPIDIERARCCIKQALKMGNESLGFRWRYLKKKDIPKSGDQRNLQ